MICLDSAAGPHSSLSAFSLQAINFSPSGGWARWASSSPAPYSLSLSYTHTHSHTLTPNILPPPFSLLAQASQPDWQEALPPSPTPHNTRARARLPGHSLPAPARLLPGPLASSVLQQKAGLPAQKVSLGSGGTTSSLGS